MAVYALNVHSSAGRETRQAALEKLLFMADAPDGVLTSVAKASKSLADQMAQAAGSSGISPLDEQ